MDVCYPFEARVVSLLPKLHIEKHKGDEARVGELRTHPKRVLVVVVYPIYRHLALGLALPIQLKIRHT